MQKINKRMKQSKIHPADYVHRDTGENMAEKVDETTSISLKEDTGQFIVNSNEYIVFDAGAMQYVQNALAKSDVSRVFTMTTMLKTEYSVLYQGNNRPHNANTLSVDLNMSQDKFYKMVRRLVSKNILAYVVCAPSGYTQKLYMLNPYIARRRKSFDNELKEFFRDITKPIPVKESKKLPVNASNEHCEPNNQDITPES